MTHTEPPVANGGKRQPAVWITAVVVFAGAVVLVIVTLPRGGPGSQRSNFAIASSAASTPHGPEPAVKLLMTVDSLQATTGGVEARLTAAPGGALPPEGATLFSSTGSAPTLVVRPNQIEQERTAFLPFTAGDVADYPFDAYRVEVDMIAVAGTDTSLADVTKRRVLPLQINGASDAAGITVSANTRTGDDKILTLTLTIRRTRVSRGWVLAMMAIYWALAILAAFITYLVVRRHRPMETRLLAWLSAMVFALIAFRTAAPGAPPVGTFLDYFAVFESVGIVAASLIALMMLYLVGGEGKPPA